MHDYSRCFISRLLVQSILPPSLPGLVFIDMGGRKQRGKCDQQQGDQAYQPEG